ncbi:MAG: PLP-dependent aminotransferase family protein, partial [Bacteroidales bacterium]|nr:PLP-dependent aminotransferase family protein [Bacteroidales bacterium]
IKCDPEQIIIVSGSLQSLFLIGSIVLNPGDVAIMEDPTFPNVHSIFKSLRAMIASMGLDDEGLNVRNLTQDQHKRAKLLHCTPSCHYPMGIRMSLNRRQELLKWASDNECFIIENDYEHEIHNFKNHTPSLFSMDSEQRVIYLSTFNRLLHPSLRLGYMIVPYYLLDAVEALLRHSHRFVPPSIQVVLNQFIEKHYLHSHVKKVIEVAEEREQIFRNTFTQVFPNSVTLHRNATRSLHLLAEINPRIDDRTVVKEFAKHNIIVHSLSKCHTGDAKRQGFIMGYSSVRPPVIKDKILQMAKLYHDGFF